MKTDEINKHFGDIFYYPFQQNSLSIEEENKQFTFSNSKFEANALSCESNNEENDECDLDFDALTKEFFNFNTQFINGDMPYTEKEKSEQLSNETKDDISKISTPQKLVQPSINYKEIIGQKDIQLFTRIEERLKNLCSIKDNSYNYIDKMSKKEVSLYDVCHKKPVIQSHIYTENVKSPQRKNKFDEAINRNNRYCSNILGRLNINAKEYVPKKRKRMVTDCINNICNEPSSQFFSNSQINENQHINQFSNWTIENDSHFNNISLSNISKREYFN